METSENIYLHELAPHRCGIVRYIKAPDEELERLMAIGVCEGRTVELIQNGDPLILRVYGTRVGVSERLARRILVQPCYPDSCTNRHTVLKKEVISPDALL